MPPIEKPDSRPSHRSIFSAANAIREFGAELKNARVEIHGALDNIIIDVTSVNLDRANEGEYEISGKIPTESGAEGDSSYVTMRIRADMRVKILAITVESSRGEPEGMSAEEARRAAAP